MGWLEQARRPVREITGALGWEGDDRKGFPCPGCGAVHRGHDDRRKAVGITRGGLGWKCHRCNEVGDGVDYLCRALQFPRLRDCTREQRRALRDWCRARGWITGPTNPFQYVPGWTPEPRAPAPTELVRPDRDEVLDLWEAGADLSEPDPDVQDFLVQRGLDGLEGVIDRANLARVLPADLQTPLAWWPNGRNRIWRLIAPAFDRHGVLASVHGRALGEPPETGEGRRLPKTLWPKHVDSRGLVFACPLGERLLRGEGEVAAVAIVEGLTDWLTLAACVIDGADDQETQDGIAVYGGTSGSWSALEGLDLADDCDVVVAVDEDEAGDRYLLDIGRALRRRHVRRLRPSAVIRSNA